MTRIYVVEDNSDFRDFCVAKNLSSAGYEVHKARDGIEALSLIERLGEPDLLWTDILMPKMTGLELIAELNKKNSKSPIIICSAKKIKVDEIEYGGERVYVNKSTMHIFMADSYTKPVKQLLEQT